MARFFQYQAKTEPVRQPLPPGLGWYQRWLEPVRPKIVIFTAVLATTGGVFPPVQPDASPNPTVNPHITADVQFRQRLIYQSRAEPVVFTTPEIITVDKWFKSWTDPFLFRRFASAQQDSVADIPSQTVSFGWNYPWSEPVRQKAGLRSSLQDWSAYLDRNPDENFESKWHYPWSEPVRFRRLATAQQQSFAYGAPSFEVVTEDKWHFPWSEPVRQKPGLRSSLQDWNAYLDRNPDDQDFESKWHQSWSEPVRFRRFPTAQHQSLIWTPFDIEGQQRWFNPLSEPVRLRRFPTSEQQVLAWVRQPDDQDIESKWHYAWSEPVRFRRISAAQQQGALVYAPFTPEVITLDKWFAEWRNPVRTKSGLFVGNQQLYAWSTFTPAPSQASWYLPLSEPVRFRRFPTAEQQSFIAPVPVFVVPSQASWYRALSEPVRFRRFPTAEQQAFIGIPFNQDQRIEARWHYAWSEPVRRKRYPVFIPPVVGPITVVANQVFLVLDATEFNNDSAIFDISVYNQAASCLVSIKEIPPPPQALFSIIEQGEIEDSPVSIKEID